MAGWGWLGWAGQVVVVWVVVGWVWAVAHKCLLMCLQRLFTQCFSACLIAMPCLPALQISGGGGGLDAGTLATVIGGLLGVGLLGYLGLSVSVPARLPAWLVLLLLYLMPLMPAMAAAPHAGSAAQSPDPHPPPRFSLPALQL